MSCSTPTLDSAYSAKPPVGADRSPAFGGSAWRLAETAMTMKLPHASSATTARLRPLRRAALRSARPSSDIRRLRADSNRASTTRTAAMAPTSSIAPAPKNAPTPGEWPLVRSWISIPAEPSRHAAASMAENTVRRPLTPGARESPPASSSRAGRRACHVTTSQIAAIATTTAQPAPISGIQRPVWKRISEPATAPLHTDDNPNSSSHV